jgi:outer membrane protein OmpA-like peptidoglycan-associated protein
MRDISARLERPESAPDPFGSTLGPSGTYLPSPGQHFDVFTRETQPRASGWVVCWSDLMMTMFIMFAALYAFQAPRIQFKTVTDLPVQDVGTGDEVKPPVPVESVLERIHDQIQDLIGRSGLRDVVEVRLVPEKAVHVTMSGDFLFGDQESVLRAGVASSLRELVAILRSAPYGLAVVGHAAPDERMKDFEGPWRLSTARALAVAMFLVGEGGVSPQRISVAGYGDQRPVHEHDGFRRSRRVELVLSTENPTEPLAETGEEDGTGIRRWVTSAGQGGL